MDHTSGTTLQAYKSWSSFSVLASQVSLSPGYPESKEANLPGQEDGSGRQGRLRVPGSSAAAGLGSEGRREESPPFYRFVAMCSNVLDEDTVLDSTKVQGVLHRKLKSQLETLVRVFEQADD